jgi:nitrogen fixation protein FixH
MLGLMLGFFGVVIGVNGLMATVAGRSFGGTVVDNSYVASQHFNRWIAEAKAQEQLGWTAALMAKDGRLSVVTVDGARVTGLAAHPLGRLPEQKLSFGADGQGRYVAHQLLPKGRWRVHLQVAKDGHSAAFLDDVTL